MEADLGLEKLIFQMMPVMPEMLVVFYNCVGDARPLATLLLLPLVLRSAAQPPGLFRLGKGGKGVVRHVLA